MKPGAWRAWRVTYGLPCCSAIVGSEHMAISTRRSARFRRDFRKASPWQAIHPGARAFSYLPNDVYKPAEWIVHTLVDVVAKGGNFEIGYGPMPNGTWPQQVIERLREVGNWMKVNGEAIYATRPYGTFSEGEDTRFTRSKDGATIYLIALKWPGRELRTRLAKISNADEVTLLGVPGKLAWRLDGDAAVIVLPNLTTKPCDYAWRFRIRRAAL
jgi:alpha-L-fucosidase